MSLECLGNGTCSIKNCKLTTMHWHCNYCKEIQIGYWNAIRMNCDLCSGEKTAKTKLSRVKNIIKNEILKNKNKEDNEIITILKSIKSEIRNGAKAFHGSNDDIDKIIDNYFDNSKPLPLISVNYHAPINLNYSRKRKFFDNTNDCYLKLIKEYNRENIYINCPYNEKDECKINGGKWDKNKKSWYIPIGMDSAKFEKWL